MKEHTMIIDKTRIAQVAYEAMNETHDEEIDIINQIGEYVTQRDSGDMQLQDKIDILLEKLLEHTKEHFSGEETLMRECRFPPYIIHKAEHNRVLQTASQHYAEWQKTGDSAHMERFVFEFLPLWIYDHIATMDTITAQFIAQVKEGKTPAMCCGA